MKIRPRDPSPARRLLWVALGALAVLGLLALGLLVAAGESSAAAAGVVVGKSYDAGGPIRSGRVTYDRPPCWRLDIRRGPITSWVCVARTDWATAKVGDRR